MISLIAFFAGGGIVYVITALTLGVWFPKLCLLAAFGSAIGVYAAAFDRLDLIPEDPDKIITLSLTAEPSAIGPRLRERRFQKMTSGEARSSS